MQRITLGNTVFEGENAAYLFTGESTVLVDTGVSSPEARADIEAGLADAGVEVTDLDAVVLTHYHADHAGLAGALQAESGATVYAHAADAPLIAGEEEAWDELESLQHTQFDEWGMPAVARTELLDFLAAGEDAGMYGEPAAVTSIVADETLEFGSLSLDVLHAPGHTAGLCCFVPRDANAPGGEDASVLTGDSILPKYTPNVGGADVRVDGALAAYVDTLRTIAERDFDRAWPGHRDPIDDPTGRAREILAHHEERAFRVLRTLADDAPLDAWTVSARLFGDLSNIHILHGPGEAFAHLDHLYETGALERVPETDRSTDGGDGIQYRLAAGTESRLETAVDGRWSL